MPIDDELGTRTICSTVAVVLIAAAAPAPASAQIHTPLGLGAWQWYLRSPDFKRMHQAGISVFRTPIRWEAVQPPGARALRFHGYDLVFAAAAKQGVRIAPILFGDPALHSPYDLAGFSRYARQVAARYGPGGRFWRSHPHLPRLPARSFEVWNEENDPGYWAGAPDPVGYLRLLRAARRSVHAVDPSAEIVFGGTAAGGMDVQQYVSAVLARGGGRLFDDYALHTYPPDPPSAVAAVQAARWLLDAHGLTRAGIVVSELGWPGEVEDPAAPLAQQAANLVATLKVLDARREQLRLRAIDWFAYRDLAGPSLEDHLGLFNRDGTPKPIWFALRGLTRG